MYRLNAYAVADRIRINVCDNCGGLPPGLAEQLYLPFVQASSDKSGLGLRFVDLPAQRRRE